MGEPYGRKLAGLRALGAGLLLALLGLCGYAGAREQTVQTSGVAVTRQTLGSVAVSQTSMEATRERLSREREQELSLLQSVLDDPAADETLRRQALEQRTQIALRMELEAQVQAALSYMGFDSVAVVCGAQAITLIAPFDVAAEQADRVRLIDAAAGQTGTSPEAVKIILAKK